MLNAALPTLHMHRRAPFSFDSSHYLNHHSNVLTIIGISVGEKAGDNEGDNGSGRKDRGLYDGAF